MPPCHCLMHASRALQCRTCFWKCQQQQQQNWVLVNLVQEVKCLIDIWWWAHCQDIWHHTQNGEIYKIKSEQIKGGWTLRQTVLHEDKQYIKGWVHIVHSDERSFSARLHIEAIDRWTVCVLTAKELLQGWSGMEPRPNLLGDLGSDVLLFVRAWLLCSHMSKETEKKGETAPCFRTTSLVDLGINTPLVLHLKT